MGDCGRLASRLTIYGSQQLRIVQFGEMLAAGECPLALSGATAAVGPKVGKGYELQAIAAPAPGIWTHPGYRVPVTSDLPANETAEGTAVDPVVVVAYDRAVDVAGDNQDKRVAGCFECLFDRRGVE